jgi:hypothetical protein
MVPAVAVASLLLALLAFLLGAQVPRASSVGPILVQGALIFPIAVGLAALVPRYLPAAEASLVARLEMLLGPLWVWLILGEAPTVATALAGIVIATTLVIHTVLGMRANQSRELGGVGP